MSFGAHARPARILPVVGLFDDVICEYPLPGWPEGEEPRFQTKDLDCAMDTYRITPDGRLLASRYEHASDGTRRRVGWRDTEHHDYLVFYTSVERAGDREWFEYRAKFTDGRIVDLLRIPERELAPRGRAEA